MSPPHFTCPRRLWLEGLDCRRTSTRTQSLKTLADQAGIAPADYARRVQRAVGKLAPNVRSGQTNGSAGWLAAMSDQVLTSLLVYGYPALGLILLLGAIGLPLPDGIATTIAGSLASQGRIDWFWAAMIVVLASVLGDAVGYGLGRMLSAEDFSSATAAGLASRQRGALGRNRCSTAGE